MTKRLGQSLVASTCIAAAVSTSAFALSLGEAELHSYLAQPLRLSLPISGTELWHGQAAEFEFRLLRPNEYLDLGMVPPTMDLSDYTIEIHGDQTNGFHIQVQSESIVREPILQVLLEVRRGRRSWIRQLDLLFDLPPRIEPGLAATQLANAAPSSSADVSAPPVTPRRITPALTKPTASGTTTFRDATPKPAAVRTPQATATGSAPTPAQDARALAPASNQYGPVRPGETLSRIAQLTRPHKKVPISRMAGALLKLNPAAFANGSPHSLRAGVILQLPNQRLLTTDDYTVAWWKNTPRLNSPPVGQSTNNSTRSSPLPKAQASRPTTAPQASASSEAQTSSGDSTHDSLLPETAQHQPKTEPYAFKAALEFHDWSRAGTPSQLGGLSKRARQAFSIKPKPKRPTRFRRKPFF